MDMRRLAIRCLVAMVAIGLMSTSAQADIILFSNYLQPAPIGSEANELAFVELQTGDDLDLFAKKDDNQATQFFTAETTLTITNPAGENTSWQVDWTTVNWDIRYILVKDGSTGGQNGQQIYSLWEVTEAQFKDGGGDVFLQAFPAKGVSHITIFGQENPTDVPEPTTLLLLGATLLGTVALGRRRR